MKETIKGKFTPKNAKKYRGNPSNIIWRSLWERRVMEWLDKNDNIIQWSSEEVIVPYKSPSDGKIHRYFVDFWFKAKTSDGKVEEFLIEIKPDRFTRPPKETRKKTKSFYYEIETYNKNRAKWLAANEYCNERNMKFRIWTEQHIDKLKLR